MSISNDSGSELLTFGVYASDCLSRSFILIFYQDILAQFKDNERNGIDELPPTQSTFSHEPKTLCLPPFLDNFTPPI
jgi:hypothetical protein